MKGNFPLMVFLMLYLLPCAGQHQYRYAPVPAWYHDYDVKFYKLDIEADDMSADVKGYTEIIAEICVQGLERFTLELDEAVQVDSVWMNGRTASFSRDGDLLYVLSHEKLPMGSMCSVTVYYVATGQNGNGFFSAVSNRKDSSWDIPVTWTLSEPFNAKHWFPCKQYLPDKADSTYIFITVPENLKAGAPGVLTAVTPVSGGKARYEWKSRYPVAYYLLSFTVADYQDYTVYAHPKGVDKPVPVQNYIYNRDGYLEKYKAIIDTTTTLIELYSELFLPYPFADEKYGHCVAPMGGGMEHQTMTTLSEFDFLLVAHELAHMWFGDLVTCATFQDVWINEGFASYAEYLALERMASREKALEWLQETHSTASWQQNGSVFVPAESADDNWRIFSASLSYRKGALLVHHIRRIVNDDNIFFEVLRGFLRKYSFSTATGMDFKQYLEEQTGMDFALFFDQWYFGEGFPIFDISWKKSGGTVDILIEHTGSAPATPAFITDLDVRITGDVDTLIQLPLRSPRELFHLNIGGDITGIEPDPGYYILKQVQSNALVRDFATDDSFVHCNTLIKRRQNLSITFSAATERNCRVKLTDTTGEKVFAETTAKRKKEMTVQMEELPNMTYLLYVQNGKDLYVRKIVKTAY
jgi:aminopeptidase N